MIAAIIQPRCFREGAGVAVGSTELVGALRALPTEPAVRDAQSGWRKYVLWGFVADFPNMKDQDSLP